MQDIKSLLKTIVVSLTSPAASSVIDALYDKKNVNEFLIAKRLKLTINQTRNILYRLADEGLVHFIRKKDVKKGGWYTYFWTLNMSKSVQRYVTLLEEQRAVLHAQLHAQQTGRFYVCPHCHVEYTEEHAIEHDYSCPECGEVVLIKDTAPMIATLTKDLAGADTRLAGIRAKLSTLLHDDEKVRQRKIQADVRKKAKERAVKRAVAAQERAKLARQKGGRRPAKQRGKKILKRVSKR